MYFSIIVSFRNREIERVKMFLLSLDKQIFRDFELIFVDYGSDLNVADEVKKLVSSYSFARYIYNDTRGMLWNRAHALNTGIFQAKNDYIVISDIDLIFEIDYLQKISSLVFDNTFYVQYCFYLKKNQDISGVTVNNTVINYVGQCILKKEYLQRVDYLDEYFFIWGAEDDRLYEKLLQLGLTKKILQPPLYNVYHKWHPALNVLFPPYWYLKNIENLFLTPNSEFSKGIIYTEQERPALQKFIKNDYTGFKQIEIRDKSDILMFYDFFKAFYTTYDNIFLTVKFSELSFNSFLKLFRNVLNSFFRMIGSNLRLYNQVEVFWQDIFTKTDELLKYFIVVNINSIKDYYLYVNEGEKKIFLIIVRQV